MARSTFRSKSKAFGDREIYREQYAFGSAMISGPPGTTIPMDAVMRLYNAVAYDRWIQGRFGSPLYTTTTLPAQQDRDSFNASKSGHLVTSPNAGFSQDDVLNFIVWDDGYNDEIVQYVDDIHVRVRVSGENAGNECVIRGKHNGWYFHPGLKKTVAQLGRDLWVSDYTLNSWTKVDVLEGRLGNAESSFDEFDDEHVVVFNSTGTFKVYLAGAWYYAYQMNTRTPGTLIESNAQTETLKYGRRYIYTAARLSGERNIRTRAEGVKVEHETGPNTWDDDRQDYGEVWTESLIGTGAKTHGVLTGAEIANASLNAVDVWSEVTDGVFVLTINSRTFNVFTDFRGVRTMREVATKVQTSIKQYWPDATCEFEDGHIVITSGLVDGTTIGGVSSGAGGTNIAGDDYLNIQAGAIDNDVVYAEPNIIEGLYTPLQSAASSTPQQHLTHFPVYGTQTVGPYGLDPVTGNAHDPERYVWLHDLRIAAAFLATKDSSGMVTAHVGMFEQADVGSVIEWENGDRDTITAYHDESHVSVEGGGYYYGGTTALQAAAIGNGQVARATQVNNIVTRTHGTIFTSLDVGRTLFWASGGYSFITDFLSENQVIVADSDTKSSQGITWNPTHRNFYDTFDDITLLARMKGLLLKNRTWVPIPSGNIGAVVPGWFVQAVRGTNKYYYTQLTPGTKYLAGYYNPGYQFNDDIKGSIMAIEEFPNRLVFYCYSSVYGGPTNTSVDIKVSGTGSYVAVMAGVQMLDNSFGVLDYGSIQDVDIGRQIMICNDWGVRIFDGYKFGPNLAEDQKTQLEAVMKDLRTWQRSTASAYKDGEYFLWGLESDA